MNMCTWVVMKWKSQLEEMSSLSETIRTEKLGSVEELQAWFVRDMEKFFLANGKKLIGWDEVVSDGLSSDAAITGGEVGRKMHCLRQLHKSRK